MANDIEIAGKDFMNYTDLRQKNEVSAIEKETIQNYARGLKPEEMKIFLAEVPFENLQEEISRRYYEMKYELQGIRRCLGL